jgi:hypothetical protein
MPAVRKLVAPAALVLLLLLAVLLGCLAPAQAQGWNPSSIVSQQFQYQLGQNFTMPTNQVIHQQ